MLRLVFTSNTSITEKCKHQNVLILLLALVFLSVCMDSCACPHAFIASENQALDKKIKMAYPLNIHNRNLRGRVRLVRKHKPQASVTVFFISNCPFYSSVLRDHAFVDLTLLRYTLCYFSNVNYMLSC